MNFELLTVTTYGIIFLLWSSILYLYLSNIRIASIRHSSVAILLTILAIDAFRTVLESAYFGLFFSSLYDYLPASVYQFLSQPGYLMIPKFVNLAAAMVVLVWLLKVWIPREVDEQAEQKQKLDESSRLLELTRFSVNQVADSLFWVSPEGKVIEVNQTACEKLGYSRDELLNMYVCDIDPDFTADKWPDHWGELKAKKTLHFTTKHMTKSGEIIPVDITANYLLHEGREYNCAIVRDMSYQTELDNIIWRHANYDELTGLPNRRLFNDRLNEAILTANRNKSSIGVIFIDLDHFKDINDTYGHDFGDQVLLKVANNLKAAIRDSDTLSRFAGDELAAILPDVSQPENIQNLLNRLLNSITQPVSVADKKVELTASFGVTFYPEDATSSEQLLINADQAMYKAKAEGRNQVYFFTPALRDAINHRVSLVRELREAINNHELELYYQPIIDFRDHQIFKLEALLRWFHPKRGYISPADFIPLAEDNNLIIELGDYVIDQALKDLSAFKTFKKNMVIGINSSPAHYKHQECVTNWLNKITDAGFSGSDFVFEITERIMMPDIHNEIDETLKELNQAGVKTAIDDFGTGYSSLSYIKRFNIDIVKIDKSFVMNVTNDAQDQAICEAIVVMAHKLDMLVVAEGIETTEQYELLKSIGCDYAQGYLFSKPVNVDGIVSLLKTTSSL